jgi:8-oxo-dGTP pyrophosphatase MutT (NUDIX family)
MEEGNQNFKFEFSAGGCVFKRDQGKVYWLLGKHSGYHKWVLPKGLIEEGEKASETAEREVEEETGIKAQVIDAKPVHIAEYFYKADLKPEPENTRRVFKYQEDGGGTTTVKKTVKFFLMEYLNGDGEEHGWEMEAVEWLVYDNALKRLEFGDEKKALTNAHQRLISNSTQKSGDLLKPRS